MSRKRTTPEEKAARILAYTMKHGAVIRARQQLRICKNREVAYAFKNKPCADCGVSYPPYVMDFDHVRGTKVDNISKMIHSCKLEAVVDEIAKCDVVCANCHRLRTYKT